MADCLDETRQKIQRAATHANDFAASVQEWAIRDENVHYVIHRDFDANDNCFIFTVEKVPPTSLPLEWSLVIGDALHNARSALDYIAWQLVRLGSAAQPLKRPTAVQFPILSQLSPGVTTWQALQNEAKTRLPGVQDLHLRIVHRFQPIVRQPSNPEREPLAVLNALSNHDKHRRLRLMRSVAVNFEADLVGVDHFKDMRVVNRTIGKPDPGTELFRVYGTPTGEGKPDVRVEFKGIAVIAFEPDPDLPNFPNLGVEYALTMIINVIRELLAEFDVIL